jgi:hypothetical protein
MIPSTTQLLDIACCLMIIAANNQAIMEDMIIS